MTRPRTLRALARRAAIRAARNAFDYLWTGIANFMIAPDPDDTDGFPRDRGDCGPDGADWGERHTREARAAHAAKSAANHDPELSDAALADAEKYRFLAILEGRPVPKRWRQSCRARDRACVCVFVPLDPDEPARLLADWRLCNWNCTRADFAAMREACEGARVDAGPDNVRAHGLPPETARVVGWRVGEILDGARARAGVGVS